MSNFFSVQRLNPVIHQVHVLTQRKVLPVSLAHRGYGVHLSPVSVWNMPRSIARYNTTKICLDSHAMFNNV